MKSLILLVILIALTTGCSQPLPEDGQVFAATFFPIAEITSSVVGSTATVYSIVPAGVEPHDYEPTPGDLAKFQRADVFITAGLEFEHVEEALLGSRAEWPAVVDAAQDVELLPASGEDIDEEYRGKVEAFDPHIWLSPVNMVLMTRSVQRELTANYPENAVVYKQNADKYVAQLEALDADYRSKLDSCSTRTILVSHRAFGYLARDYNLNQLSIGGLSPDAEPTPGQLVDLVDAARSHSLKYIFTEELLDPRIAETIADEVGAQTLILSPAEGSPNSEDTYLSIMRRNLDNLRIGLGCT